MVAGMIIMYIGGFMAWNDVDYGGLDVVVLLVGAAMTFGPALIAGNSKKS